MKYLAALASLAVAIVCADTRPVYAQQGPDEIAAECAQALRTSVARLEDALSDKVSRCVPRIKRLKEAGKTKRARAVARRCISSINNTSRAAREHVEDVCERCINALLDFGAVDLAERVRGWCADALDEIDQLRTRARRAVRDALNS